MSVVWNFYFCTNGGKGDGGVDHDTFGMTNIWKAITSKTCLNHARMNALYTHTSDTCSAAVT